jgi:hypothetical protein
MVLLPRISITRDFEVCEKDLYEPGAEFARGGCDAVAGAAVAGGEDFSGNLGYRVSMCEGDRVACELTMNVVTLGPRLKAMWLRTYKTIKPERLVSSNLVQALPVTMKRTKSTRKPQSWMTLGETYLTILIINKPPVMVPIDTMTRVCKLLSRSVANTEAFLGLLLSSRSGSCHI